MPIVRPPLALVLVCAVVLLAILWLLAAPRGSSVSRWAGSSGGQTLTGQAKPISGRMLPADSFVMAVDDGLYPDGREDLQTALGAAYAYVAGRFGAGASGQFTAAIHNQPDCGLHGLADTNARIVNVYTCPSIGSDRAVAIMAHEMVHQLAADRYGPPHLSADMILLEGLATWGAGSYWLGPYQTFRDYVRGEYGDPPYALATNYAGLGVGAMNALYYEWASFVEFLIQTYGRASFDKLYVSGSSQPGTADYQGVYGKGLADLEAEWRAWLAQG